MNGKCILSQKDLCISGILCLFIRIHLWFLVSIPLNCWIDHHILGFQLSLQISDCQDFPTSSCIWHQDEWDVSFKKWDAGWVTTNQSQFQEKLKSWSFMTFLYHHPQSGVGPSMIILSWLFYKRKIDEFYML